MGLLTKIFGNTDGGAGSAVERSEGEPPGPSPGREASAEASASRDADPGSSGIRPAVSAPPALTREPSRSPAPSRRPEHPRMYLRPTPMVIDPSVPGSTRRPQIALRATGKESGTHRVTREVTPPEPPPPPLAGASASTEASTKLRANPTPPSGTRLQPAMVVSPVSLTAEELQLPPGTRPKMQTLLGLGMGYGLEAAPDAAAQPEGARARRIKTPQVEQRIVRELLAARDGFLPAQRQRLERQMSLEQLAQATPEVLARELEAPLERARQLSELVAAYMSERQRRSDSAARESGLAEALGELARRSREFDDCDDDQAEQRLARLRRRDASTQVNLLLAEQGELELLDALEPCAIAKRLERLREWLSAGAVRQR